MNLFVRDHIMIDRISVWIKTCFSTISHSRQTITESYPNRILLALFMCEGLSSMLKTKHHLLCGYNDAWKCDFYRSIFGVLSDESVFAEMSHAHSTSDTHTLTPVIVMHNL